jgi:hypothetical protein
MRRGLYRQTGKKEDKEKVLEKIQEEGLMVVGRHQYFREKQISIQMWLLHFSS